MRATVCVCRCETCVDSDCEGHVCAPHAAGRWIIVSPHMAHPMPNDYGNEDAARQFVDTLGFEWLTIRQQQ